MYLIIILKEVERYGDLLQDATKTKEEEERRMAAAGTVWQNAIMSVMRKQLQDLKATLRKKDTTLSIKVRRGEGGREGQDGRGSKVVRGKGRWGERSWG